MSGPQQTVSATKSVVVNVSLNMKVPRVERLPLSVELTQVTGRQIKAPRSSSAVEAVALADLTAETAANCFLQIWEMDAYTFTSYSDEETDRSASPSNQLVASIAGVVVKRAKGQYEFQLPQSFVRPAFDPVVAAANGFIRLKLRDTTETMRILNLHMPQYEKFFELGATIRTEADDTSYAGLTTQLPFQLRNEIASIRHQMRQRGGIAVSIAGNWRVDPEGITEKLVEVPVTEKVKGVEVQVMEKGVPKMRSVKKYYKGDKNVYKDVLGNGIGTVYFTSNNDAEFERQAEETLAVLPSFMPSPDRTVKIGSHLFDQNKDTTLAELPGRIEASRLAAGKALAENDAFLKAAAEGSEDWQGEVAAPALAQCPRLATLMILCHGWRDGLTIAGDEKDSHLRKTRTSNVGSWLPAIAPHCVANFNLALYACLCGANVVVDDSKSKDPYMGRFFPAEEIGFDSFAWTIFHGLKDLGISEPSVWAHTVAAHTTRNSYLRVFCSQGAGDFVNIAMQTPRIDHFYKISGAFSGGESSVHRGNIIREVCTYHGGYFDWAWNGGKSVSGATSWFDQGVADEVSVIMAEVRKIVAGVSPVLEEEVIFEDATRKVITSANAAAFKPKETPDPMLTRVLKLSHFPVGTAPFRLHVALVKGIQMACDRVKDNVAEPIATIVEVRDEGQSAIIRANHSGHREKLGEKAIALAGEGWMTGAQKLSEGRVLVSVRPGGPTEIVTPG